MQNFSARTLSAPAPPCSWSTPQLRGGGPGTEPGPLQTHSRSSLLLQGWPPLCPASGPAAEPRTGHRARCSRGSWGSDPSDDSPPRLADRADWGLKTVLSIRNGLLHLPMMATLATIITPISRRGTEAWGVRVTHPRSS